MFLLNVITPYRRQWWTALSLSTGALVVGCTRNWASPYIAKLTAPDNTHPLKLTPSEASWVASLLFLGRLFGAAVGAGIQDFIGRKRTLLLVSVPFAVGWTLIIIAPSVSWLYASQISIGLSVGLMYSASASFLGEIAGPMIRGRLILVNTLAMATGSFIGAVIGGLFPMEIFSYMCLALTGLFIVTFGFVPESPYYHITNGDIQKAERSLKWFNKDVNVTQEFQTLQRFLENSSFSAKSRWDELKKRKNQKNFLVIFFINVLPYLSGLNALNPYTELILTKGKVQLTPSVVVMGLSFLIILANIVAVTLVDKFGRRPLMMGSGLGLTLGHILLGSHFHMLSLGIDPKFIHWLPVFSLTIVFFSIPCGLGTVNHALLGELFPPILKTPASFLFTATSGIAAFAVSKSYQSYIDLVGEKYVFWTFATSALCSVVFSYFFIPETKQKSLIDIQENLKNANNDTEVAPKMPSGILKATADVHSRL